MGDLKGHGAGGSLFLLFGFLWAVGCLKRYFICRKNNLGYQATLNYGCPCPCGHTCGRLPLEAILKIALGVLGAFFEISLNMPPNPGMIQHGTVYALFGMSGFIDLSMHCGVPLPSGTDYLTLALTFALEGFLFANHLHGRPPVDVQLHMVLVYATVVTVIVLLLEARYQNSAVLAMSRAFLMMLKGSWLWATGIILYGHGFTIDDKNDVWDLNDHMQVMQVSIYFTWHCAVHVINLFILFVLFFCIYGRMTTSSNRHTGIPLNPLYSGICGDDDKAYKLLVNHDDTNSDIEFERPLNQPLMKPGINV